jgi:hypothetical protein
MPIQEEAVEIKRDGNKNVPPTVGQEALSYNENHDDEMDKLEGRKNVPKLVGRTHIYNENHDDVIV